MIAATRFNGLQGPQAKAAERACQADLGELASGRRSEIVHVCESLSSLCYVAGVSIGGVEVGLSRMDFDTHSSVSIFALATPFPRNCVDVHTLVRFDASVHPSKINPAWMMPRHGVSTCAASRNIDPLKKVMDFMLHVNPLKTSGEHHLPKTVMDAHFQAIQRKVHTAHLLTVHYRK